MAAPQPQQSPTQPRLPLMLFALLLATMIIALYLPSLTGRFGGEPRYPVAYSLFKNLANDNKVAEVVMRGHLIEGRLNETLALGPKGEQGRLFSTQIPVIGDPELLATLSKAGVTVQVEKPEEPGAGRGLILLLPWLLLMAFFLWTFYRAYRQIGGAMGGRPGELQRFLTSVTTQAEVPKVTFKDVAGQANAKREVEELVEYLKNPAAYRKLGAEVPHGVLLMGPPGTGKTLMARALAGEAGVPFYSISGSEFIELFVGVGAARVRNLFATAKKNAPSIIFVDELDSVGRTRGTGLGGGHDEREQTLNQILAEMDGFSGHEAVLVLAATNRPDVLDPALLRPGRFDRHVTLDLPDRRDREEILQLHTVKVPLSADVDLATLSAGTPGFSGADLKNLVNEAALLALRDKQEKVTMHHFDEARDKVMLGTVRLLAIQPEERHRLAVHEAGHTLVAFYLPHADPLYKVTIIPRGQALGGTMQLPEEERYTLPEEYLHDRLALMLGGRVAEKLMLGSVSSGADNDIRQATGLARAMVTRWGMAEEIGPMDLRESEEHPFLGREIAQPRTFSESSAEAVDQAVRKLLTEAEEMAKGVLEAHRQELSRLIDRLEQDETLDKPAIEACLSGSEQSPPASES